MLNIPREKPVAALRALLPALIPPCGMQLPKAKPMTRWEKFAQEKGIEKKKRSKMVRVAACGCMVTCGAVVQVPCTPATTHEHACIASEHGSID